MSQVFGSGLSGNSFDFREFIKNPSVILRVISFVFAVVVCSCIGSGGYIRNECLFSNSSACGYATTIGVIACLACVAFLALDAVFPQLSSVEQRKYVLYLDMAFSAFWAFLWFVGFCYMTNKLNTEHPNVALNDPRGAIAFSFFSIISWGLQCFFAVRKYQSGDGDMFASSDDVLDQQPYSGSYPDSTGRGSGSGGLYNDDQMIGGDLSGGGYQQQQQQQQHY